MFWGSVSHPGASFVFTGECYDKENLGPFQDLSGQRSKTTENRQDG
jgi:hypothetical protein